MSLNLAFCPLQIGVSTYIHMRWLIILPDNFSRWKYQSLNIKNLVKTYGPLLSYFFLYRLFLLISILLTIIIPFAVFFWDVHVSWINLGTFGGAHKSWGDGLFRSKMPGSSSTSDLSSTTQSFWLNLGLSTSAVQSSQLLVSQMLSGAQCSSLSAGSRTIVLGRWTFNTWIHPLPRSIGNRALGNGDLSNNLNAAIPSRWMVDQDALSITSEFELYHTAVISLFWAVESFCLSLKFWLPCHISKMW